MRFTGTVRKLHALEDNPEMAKMTLGIRQPDSPGRVNFISFFIKVSELPDYHLGDVVDIDVSNP